MASSDRYPLGVQLYSVIDEMAADFDGTLLRIAAAGFQEVEFAGFFGRKATQVVGALHAAGLRGAAGHFGHDVLRDNLSETVDFANAVGLKYMVCADSFVGDDLRYLALDDWHRNADFSNAVGAKIRAAGMIFGYHNHIAEFQRFGDVVAYDEFINRTDPALVTLELDCAWAIAMDKDPVDYLKRYPQRIRMLHIKDITAIPSPGTAHVSNVQTTEVGKGVIDWRRIFAAAKRAHVEHYFVEQEAPFSHSPIESVKSSAQYLRKLRLPLD